MNTGTSTRVMERETYDALQGSITKWRRIVEGTGLDAAGANCPLCLKFNNDDTRARGQQCVGCPVMDATKQSSCRGTPYEEFTSLAETVAAELDGRWVNQYRAASPLAKAAALRELRFLEGLLPAAVDLGEKAPQPATVHPQNLARMLRLEDVEKAGRLRSRLKMLDNALDTKLTDCTVYARGTELTGYMDEVLARKLRELVRSYVRVARDVVQQELREMGVDAPTRDTKAEDEADGKLYTAHESVLVGSGGGGTNGGMRTL